MPDTFSTSTQILPDHVAQGATASANLFGGNILATRGTMTGDGSYAELVGDLGVTGLRYPGGSLTEYNFDISDPDASVVTHAVTGETSSFIPLSDFMSFASDNGNGVTIVIPTRDQLGTTPDANGNLEPDIDAAELRAFIHDVTAGVYGNADIIGFEIGNEYWGSGNMNAVEYGQLSSEMAVIIDDELANVAATTGAATDDISVLVQMGRNCGTSSLSDEYAGWESHNVIDDLSSTYADSDISYENIGFKGNVNWTQVNNKLITMAFDSPEKVDAVDGVIGHVYTYGETTPNSGRWTLDTIQNSWLEKEGFEDLEVHITEWNMKPPFALDRQDDYGLFEAHELLDIVEDFMATGVDSANVWPLLQNTANTLSPGETYTELTAPGEMFAMMSEHLPGKTAIDFTPNGDRNTEFDAGPVDVHAFAGDGDMVLYIVSTLDETAMTDIVLSNLVAGFDDMEISVLGVAQGDNPGNTSSQAEVQHLNQEDVYEDGVIEADLDEGEIMQVIIHGIVPTEGFAPVIDAINADDMFDPALVITDEDVLTIEIDETTQDDESDSTGGMGDIGLLLAFLPLLALFG